METAEVKSLKQNTEIGVGEKSGAHNSKEDFVSEKSAVDGCTLDQSKKKIICDICYKEFSDSCSLSEHLVLHGEKPFLCFLCRKRFLEKCELETHFHSHIGEKSFICYVCKKEFTDFINFNNHVCFYSNEKPNTSSRFVEKDKLNTCRCYQSEKNPCDTCQKELSEEFSSVIHSVDKGNKEYNSIIQSIHDSEYSSDIHPTNDNTSKKRFKCHVCQRAFAHKCRLNSHLRTHTGIRPISCNICSKRFHTMYQLITHLRIHTGEKPYECDICGKVFSQSSTLNRHRLTHTGERPFVCEVCKKGFCDRSDLNKHMRKHTGEKPFSCSTCNKKFSRKSTLKNHQRLHNR